MLSPAQISSIAQARGDTVVNPNAGASSPGTDAAASFAKAVNFDPSTPADETSKPGLLDRIGSDFNERQNSAADAQVSADNGEESPVEAAAHTIGEGAGFVGDIGKEALKSVGDSITGTSENGTTKSLTDVIGDAAPEIFTPKAKQDLIDFQKNHPVASDYLGALFNVAGIIPEGKLAEAGLDTGVDAAKGGIDVVKNADSAVGDAAVKAREAAQVSASKSNVAPTFESAASRLNENAQAITPRGLVATNVKDPVSTYDEFSAQDAKAAKDSKEDPSIAIVGSRIGDAFKDVVKMRQNAGKDMESELSKIASTKTDVSDAASKFEDELKDNGLNIDPETGGLSAEGQTKLSTTDQNLLGKYTQEVQKLGPNPTAKDLDAFIGRMPNEIKALKATNGVTFKTNAERLINNHLNDLRDTLGKVGTPAYKSARAQYAALSNFVKEGAPHLGKVTQSGDFAKDASLAKSSVQSVLNNGKKDWLLKLEQLSGYPALDESTLALQSMKDSGDYRGRSLLDLIANKDGLPDIPTTPSGLVYKMASGLWNAGKKQFLGTPAEQTRRYLQSIAKKK